MPVTKPTPKSRLSEAQPRWATSRRFERPTLGPRIAAIAKKLGTPLMPHQQLIADVGFEIMPGTGLPAYREVIFTKPRQTGKTALVLAIETERCTVWDERQHVLYTAQTGTDARDKLLEDQVPVLEARMAQYVRRVYRAKGEEAIRFRNGSRIQLAASSHKSGHGATIDMGVLDECWADEDNRREQTIVPMMKTRPMAQLIVCSTQGTQKSSYLNRKTEIGRAAAAADKGSGTAYFEWSLPKDADIANPEMWRLYMPALGRTISEEVIAHDLSTMDEAEFRRADCNQSTMNEHDRVIPPVLWEAVQDPAAKSDRESRMAFGVDVLPDRSWAAIVASDGHTIEIIDHRPSTGWIVERMLELSASWNGYAVVDGGGPAVSIADDLERKGVTVQRLTNTEVTAACARMYDDIADRNVVFRTDPDFELAVEGLAKRPVGDRFVWSRSASLVDITPFMAATLAYEQAMHQTTLAPFAMWGE